MRTEKGIRAIIENINEFHKALIKYSRYNMSCVTKYIGFNEKLSPIVTDAVESLEEDENEIYFYTTADIARCLSVGCTNIITDASTQVNLFIGSIETRVSGHLPEKDAVLFPDQNLADLFAYAIGTHAKYQWGVLVGGEVIT